MPGLWCDKRALKNGGRVTLAKARILASVRGIGGMTFRNKVDVARYAPKRAPK